jgi:hypothetical protein
VAEPERAILGLGGHDAAGRRGELRISNDQFEII